MPAAPKEHDPVPAAPAGRPRFRHDQAADAGAWAGEQGGDAGLHVHHRRRAGELVLPAGDPHRSDEPGEPGARVIDAAVAGHDRGRGAQHDMAERLHLAELARGGDGIGRRGGIWWGGLRGRRRRGGRRRAAGGGGEGSV